MNWELYLDLGNTTLHWGAYADDKWQAEGRLPTALLNVETLGTHLSEALQAAQLSPAELAAVVAVASSQQNVLALEASIRDTFGRDLLLVGRDLQPAMQIDYYEPTRIGSDRVVNALAARELYGTPCIVLDFGTCLTCEIVSSDGHLMGGAIAAGLPVILSGLTAQVSWLRRPFEKATQMQTVDGPGRSTEENLYIGCIRGMAATADWLVETARRWTASDAHTVATGGDAPLIVPLCRNQFELAPMLSLEGLRIIEQRAALA